MEYSKQRKKQLIRAWLDGEILHSDNIADLDVWTDVERRDLKNRVASVVESLRPSSKEPNPYHCLLIFIGGGPLSGKSTINHLLMQQPELERVSVKITPEQIRAAIPEYSMLRNIPYEKEIIEELHLNDYEVARLRQHSYNFVIDEVAKITQLAIEKFSREGYPIIVESHMDHPEVVEQNLEAAKAQGYETLLIAPDIDVPTFFARGEERLKRTSKRFFPLDGLGRHRGFEEYWPEYAKQFDVACRVNNNAEKPSLMALAVDGNLSVIDEVAYDRARQKRGIDVTGDTPDEALQYKAFDRTRIKSETGHLENGHTKGHARNKRGVNRALGFLERVIETIPGPSARK
ncbi:MAG: zeta toxin family protein [Rickettsiales bacterium]|jgi:hypothetical protein|nr:zeta toxin family protein [Rickettsiales bacterium]